MVQKKSSPKRKATAVKGKSAPRPLVSRWLMWVVAAVFVGLLGFALSWLFSYSDVFVGDRSSIAAVVFAVIGIFLVFYAGFVILGKFGPWRSILAFFSTLAVFFNYSFFAGSTMMAWLSDIRITIKTGVWVSPQDGLLFLGSFLFVAALATLFQAALGRQKHRSSTLVVLAVLALLSLLVIIY